MAAITAELSGAFCWLVYSILFHVTWIPGIVAISCYDCKGTYDGSDCGRVLNRPDSVPVAVKECDGKTCKTHYETYGNGSVSYVRGCPPHGRCEERYSSKVSWSDPDNTGRATIVRCCDTDKCNNWLKEQRCYECHGNKLEDCPIVASNRMNTKLCEGFCYTLYNFTKGSLRVERGCDDLDCDGKTVKTFDPNTNSQVSRTCCIGDVCNRRMEVFQCYECSGVGDNSDCGKKVNPSAEQYLHMCPEPSSCFCQTEYWRNETGVFYERLRQRGSCLTVRRDYNSSNGIYLSDCCSSQKCNQEFNLYQGDDASEEEYMYNYDDPDETASAESPFHSRNILSSLLHIWMIAISAYI